MVVHEVGDGERKAGQVVFEEGDASEASGAVTGWSGVQPGDQDVIDCAAVVRAELLQVGPTAVAMDDRPGHAV